MTTQGAPPDDRPELSISFHAFWEGFRGKGSFFDRALSRRYRVLVEPQGRDVQFFSVFSRPELGARTGSRPLRVWWSGEVLEPARAIYDLHFGALPRSMLGERWHRMPCWVPALHLYAATGPAGLLERLSRPRAVEPRDRFCNFVYSNPTSLRAEFFLRLHERRAVDSLGRLLPGPEAPVQDKLAALRDYRWTLAFENALSPGYVTEKLLDPLVAGSVPVYWGADEAREDFNPRAFLFARDFATFDDLIAHLLRLDDAREAWAEMAAEPAFPGGRLRYEHTPDFFVDRIANALERRLTAPVKDADNLRLQEAPLISGKVVGTPRRKRLKGLRRFWRRLRGK